MIRCKFSCQVCGASEVWFEVRARRPGEGLRHRTRLPVAAGLRSAHAMFDLLCPGRVMSLWLPDPVAGKGVGEE